ncbi:hypothetical protein BDQ17DRAFT_472265 [Cyathus striatus]|nr:hypothetical protein BDQ17DRAFT_472265 [Cyathus striatus]
MATPSSSATSPSPPMAYLPHAQLQPSSVDMLSLDPQEKEQRKKAVQKFLARAEISMVTRALRTRLSYASYKAIHNVSHVPLRDLEAQTQPQAQSQAASFSRTIAAKRKASGTPHYYPNQPPNANLASATPRRGGSGTMAPPPVSSPRTPHPSHGSTSAAANEQASSSRTPSHATSLYASILAPPPSKQARTIHNAADPPVPPPSRPAPSPRVRTVKASPRNTADGRGARQGAKARQNKAVTSPDKRKKQRVSQDKGKQKEQERAMDVDVDGDVDMKAAATLTSLLLHHRPSIAGSTSSPRSSVDGSDTGSQYSYSQFTQSSARSSGRVTAPTQSTTPLLAPVHPTSAPPAPAPQVNAAESSTARVNAANSNSTPPPATLQGTPRAAPTDNEAADLMLFLATSPSPARASKDARDMAAYRALGGGPEALRAKGRVLFSNQVGSGSPGPGGNPESLAVAHGTHRAPSALSRGAEGSFNSSISSIGGDMGGRRSESSTPRPMSAPTGASQLLPPALMTLLPSAPTSPARKENIATNSPRSTYVQAAPVPPGEFNFSDFINASPSPARGTVGQGHKRNHSLREDVGRKLFVEGNGGLAAPTGHSPPKRSQPHPQDDRGLGAGIDLHS